MPASAYRNPDPQLRPLLCEIKTAATDPAPMPELTFASYREFADSGARLGYERHYFRRRRKLVALLADALVDQYASTDALADAIWSTCGEYSWALPAHIRDDAPHAVDLFAAETAHTLAEAVALLNEDHRLDWRVARRVRDEVDRRIFARLEDPAPLSWETATNNWAAVCAGASGMAALALLEDGPRLTAILKRCEDAMSHFLSGYPDDGGCVEGISYWVYGFGYFVYFAEALRARTNVDLLADSKVAEIAAFPQKVSLGGNAFVAFSDALERPFLPAGLLTRLAERFGTDGAREIPGFDTDHCYRWGHLSRTLTWYRPMPVRSTDGTRYLPDLAWVVDRGELSFAAKGGHNDEPHNHNDLGHFVLRVRDHTVLDDLGAGEYTREYFGPGRYQSLHPSSEGHSVPKFGGHPQLPGVHRRARVLDFSSDDGGLTFVLDLTAAYDVPGLRSFVRRFRWERKGILHLIDTIESDAVLPLDELFVTRVQPRLETGQVVWPGLLRLSYPDLTPAIEALSTTDHHGRPERVYRIRLSGNAPTGQAEFSFRFDAT